MKRLFVAVILALCPLLALLLITPRADASPNLAQAWIERSERLRSETDALIAQLEDGEDAQPGPVYIDGLVLFAATAARLAALSDEQTNRPAAGCALRQLTAATEDHLTAMQTAATATDLHDALSRQSITLRAARMAAAMAFQRRAELDRISTSVAACEQASH